MKYTVRYRDTINTWKIAYDDVSDYVKAVKLAAKFGNKHKTTTSVVRQGEDGILAYIRPELRRR